jgi:glycosyltransferase involved in cell wall biosynthesis
MKIVIVRREPGVAFSMDVCADNLVAGLKALQPDWQITEIAPEPWSKHGNLWQSGTGLRKYYERLWRHPCAVSRLEGDIFHIIDHSNAHVAYWLKKKGCKIVVTCHDLVQFVYPEILKEQARFPALSMASWKYSVGGMKHADCVVAVSSNTVKDVAKMLPIPLERIAVVPNGVESYFRPLPSTEVVAIRQRYEGSAETFCLLNVGSTHQRKNIPTILKALVMLRDRGFPARLWKVGDEFTPEQAAFIQSQALEPLITLIGKPDKANLLELYNAADVLIAPSLYEGFGLTILEAMACGTPVITSNVSSLPEVCGDAAVLVDPINITAIVDAVLQIYDNPIFRLNLVKRGLERTKLFSWEATAEKVASVYEKIVLQKQGIKTTKGQA